MGGGRRSFSVYNGLKDKNRSLRLIETLRSLFLDTLSLLFAIAAYPGNVTKVKKLIYTHYYYDNVT